MTALQAIILGVIQGITEFIPVSSSGHLVILHEWLGVTDNGLTFDVALHLGTLLALLFYFYKDLVRLMRAVLGRTPEARLAWLLLLATVPAAVGGFLLQGLAESTFRSVPLAAANLIIVALFMLLAEHQYARQIFEPKTTLGHVSKRQALGVGLAQVLAIIPGVSRSGATITAGLFLGIDRMAATRFSFLLGIPIMLGAIIKVLASDAGLSFIANQGDIFITGVITALLSGLLAIRFMLAYLAKHTLKIFAYYRIALGIIILTTLFL